VCVVCLFPASLFASVSMTAEGTKYCLSRSESSSWLACDACPEARPSSEMSSTSALRGSTRGTSRARVGSSPDTRRMEAVESPSSCASRGMERSTPKVLKPISRAAGLVAKAAHAAITPSVPAPRANRLHPLPLEDARISSSSDARSGNLSNGLVAEARMVRVRACVRAPRVARVVGLERRRPRRNARG